MRSVTARSGLVSPFRSRMTTNHGLAPVAKSVFAPKLPVPSPSSTDTVSAC